MRGMVQGMPSARPDTAAPPRVSQSSLETLAAMAGLARATESVVHVVVARGPGVVDHARTVGQAAGLDVSVDLKPFSIRVRFDGTPA